MSERLKRAAEGMVSRISDRLRKYGTIGRKNADGTVEINVRGRRGYIYLTLRNAQTGAQTAHPARNDTGVPLAAGAAVEYRVQGTTFIIVAKSNSGDLATPVPGSPGGGEIHVHDLRYFKKTEHINVSAGAADAGKPIVLNASGEVDATMIDLTGVDIGAVIHAAAVETTPLDADETAILDSASSFALRRITWTTIKAFLKTYFDTLYELAGAIATHAALTVTHGATGAIVGTTNTQTLSSKTLTAPTIADFTNAAHDHGDADDGGALAAAAIANDAITFAKMQNIATDSLIGRDTAGTGDPENILLNATLSMDGAGNLQRAALTGDVTATAGSNATTIANDAVTNAKLDNMADATVKGQTLGGGTANPVDLTRAQLRDIAGVQGYKAPCRVATTANITLSGAQGIDGLTMTDGDRILVLQQTASLNNGIYIYNSGGAYARAEDADASADFVSGMVVAVDNGNTWFDTLFMLTTNGAINLGVTGLAFEAVSGISMLQQGPGILKSGNIISVRVDDVTIEIVGDEIRTIDNSGTWSPTVRGDTLGTLSVTYTIQTGTYTQIHNRIWFDIFIRINTITIGTGSGNMRVSLPITAGTGQGRAQGSVYTQGVDLPATGFGLTFGANNSSAYGYIFATVDNGAALLVQITDLAAGDDISISGMYTV